MTLDGLMVLVPGWMTLDGLIVLVTRLDDSGWSDGSDDSSLGRYVFGSEISYNKAPPRLPGLGC